MIKKFELDLGDGKTLSFETGKLAKEASGSVVVRLGDTVVIAATVASQTPREGIDFFPLLVDYEEKFYAAGKIPGGFFKREGKPSENAVLTSRKIDRPIRPLFPEGFRNDVQIAITPLAVDHENMPDILALNGASAALAISDIPFNGPLGAVRVAKVDGKIIINPTAQELEASVMDVVVAGTKDKIMMIEAGAKQVSEAEVLEAIEEAHKAIKKLVKLQEEMAKAVGKKKREIAIYAPAKEIVELVKKSSAKVKEVIIGKDKAAQKEALSVLADEILKNIKAETADQLKQQKKDVKTALEDEQKRLIREMMFKDGKRLDGRKLDELREIKAEVSALPRVHGSGLFSRGQTQVMTIATLGSLGEEQRIDALNVEEVTKSYMHHYNFPAYSVGEVRPNRGPGRREIGHGSLAEKALMPVLPEESKFPYTIRLVSEVMGSNGSTSMASTCGSTLALMDAGVPIEAPVAGISIGLISEGDKYVTLADIQGIEDHFGDMDFKVAGTEKGITAIQVDIKIDGLSLEIVKQALAEARTNRLKILDVMKKAIAAPRQELSEFAPRVITMNINPEKIGLVIGPGGKMIKKIVEETGAKIDIEDDGVVLITAIDAEGGKKAQRMIEQLTYEPKVGEVFLGKVVRIMNFGAFIEIIPGKDGLCHISQISDKRIAKVEDAIDIGDEVVVKLVEVDDVGRLNLSMKAVSEEEKKKFSK
ncbi:polyribonucleotide nucleotidyltransferase [candidate division WOR-1 bacterium RIFOXYB2_FULL_42_35]|uniref:Polyribonucleotide nucleotidyltransferase n=1 Tax=candidate division WOR-1 bacterium RIFOXYC2_FULL_41_25 TaxID=1802586 RepID=A0A1F4TJP9_UNCSA|nr:MAG: polyribonucleotide nucleotidyltransferase [candidate division WOR-1 bacterium RIFOXYA2_FULL_41_14]OGC21886.1 MAG: polyribonucleotide nucleotidyltransferase [candidate division WOR-1 bacterium RIFOXYB2_FULL_42_35]OGC32750.1 MAG: polyribonucleotide nucleotidyltransferase [candidate division WOR-1 bacterium RIFOXYC2_FULL_41_25]OGC42546.1 MAG: polyribonucleotide nucleotidyltransferase [candidate division WOR-1 bacterium RIFOXYD2_FULL_41_8]